MGNQEQIIIVIPAKSDKCLLLDSEPVEFFAFNIRYLYF